MAATQTTVADRMTLAIAGMLDQSEMVASIRSYTSEEASAEIPFGTMVIRGTDEDNGVLQVHTSGATVIALLAGVVVHSHAYAKTQELGDTGLKPDTTFGVLQKGRIWVTTEDACDPGDAVRVRVVVAGAEVKGAFRVAADSTDCVVLSKTMARWLTSAGAGGLALLELDMLAIDAVAD